MSDSSLNLAIDEAALEGTASAEADSEATAPPNTDRKIKPSGGRSMALPFLLVLLFCGAAGVGVFGLTATQTASSLRTEMTVLQTEMGALTATVAGLQTQNTHYEGILTRVRAATGSLQASLAELNQLAGLPAPSAPLPSAAL